MLKSAGADIRESLLDFKPTDAIAGGIQQCGSIPGRVVQRTGIDHAGMTNTLVLHGVRVSVQQQVQQSAQLALQVIAVHELLFVTHRTTNHVVMHDADAQPTSPLVYLETFFEPPQLGLTKTTEVTK